MSVADDARRIRNGLTTFDGEGFLTQRVFSAFYPIRTKEDL